ncbi:MAG TPA: RluA family pseudouridine synthase, partial [Xanthobacteraceae bacterium]|nr:RluA family pseudouridine synthase [Xanthobacteraceae bacterium]
MAGPRGQDRRGKATGRPTGKPAGKPFRQRPGGAAAAGPGKRRRPFSDRDKGAAAAGKKAAAGPRKTRAPRRAVDSSERRPAAPVKAAPIRRATPIEQAVEAPAPQQATRVQTVAVTPDEAGMRVDRFLEAKFPGLSFSHIHRVIRKGELRV